MKRDPSEGPAPAGRGGVGWIHAIRTRLFVSFALLALLLTLALSLWIEREARDQLEGELTARLQAVAGSALSALRPSLVPGLLSFTPAQQSLRTYRDARSELLALRDLTGVRRIFLADLEGRSFVDTDARVGIGDPLPELRGNRPELLALREGEPAAAPLFTDESGEIRKTGYVPVELGGEAIAIVGVEADAAFLAAVRSLRARILTVGGIGLAVALALSLLLARGLTRPLDRLVAWARFPASGDLSRPVPRTGRDEIGLLAETLEGMRGHLETQDRELRAMISGVAHEIRNPLGGMRLYTEMVSRDPSIGEAQRGKLGKVLGELDQLSRIVDEFLTYARPASPVPESLPLAERVAELLGWSEGEARERGVAVRMPEAGGAARARVDPTHFRQIVRNLLGNAIEACAPGGSVELSWRVEGAEVVLDVDDDGPGIAPEVRARIFEPFFTTKMHGAGLGLPIVQRLALLNQGRIEALESPGGGARFRLRLPKGGPD